MHENINEYRAAMGFEEKGDFDAEHLDHGLQPAVLDFARKTLDEATPLNDGGFCLVTVDLPEEFASVPCALYGPKMGDEPISDKDAAVKWFVRTGGQPRLSASRVMDLQLRPSRQLTVIGLKTKESNVLFTAFGGPSADREVGDYWMLKEAVEGDTVASIAASLGFWGEHVLACREAFVSLYDIERMVLTGNLRPLADILPSMFYAREASDNVTHHGPDGLAVGDSFVVSILDHKCAAVKRALKLELDPGEDILSYTLAAAFHDSRKAETAVRKNGDWSFPRHGVGDADVFDSDMAFLRHLDPSYFDEVWGNCVRNARGIIEFHERPRELMLSEAGFKPWAKFEAEAGAETMRRAVLFSACCDTHKEDQRQAIIAAFEAYLAEKEARKEEEAAKPPILITGADIKAALGSEAPKGKDFGTLLKRAQILALEQFESGTDVDPVAISKQAGSELGLLSR